MAAALDVGLCGEHRRYSALHDWGYLRRRPRQYPDCGGARCGVHYLDRSRKSLLFREKWKFHLAIATRLSILQIKLRLAGADTKALTDEYAAILDSYANSIPIAGREGQ
jgi:hypothetical protein